MAQSPSLGYQIHLEFLFACDRTTLLHHAYGAEGISPWNAPDRGKLDHAALEHLAFILSGYSAVAETEVRVATRSPEAPRAFWSVRLGAGKAGMDMYGREYGTETPFKRTDDAHVCCAQLVSPAFTNNDQQWTAFTTSTQRIVSRLQTPGSLHPPGSSPPNIDRITHLAWTNESCSFTVTVQPTATGDKDTYISWPALQNLYAAWGSCAQAVELVQNPRRHSSHNNTMLAYRKLAPAADETLSTQRLFAIPSLAVYLNFEAHVAAQVEISRLSVLVDGSGEQKCSGVRFDEHRATLDVKQIQFWTRFTHQALVACQDMAAAGGRFGAGGSQSVGFAHFSERLIREQWVRDHACRTIWENGQGR
ncbi:MAG: hypothetical protein L6R35_006458 [Caloplaca aegaea]|nr:MAG: hypothetical protein L6R35_006458 [Caloplaca aegaea]